MWKKWAFNIKIESGTSTQKWSKTTKEISKGKVKKYPKGNCRNRKEQPKKIEKKLKWNANLSY